MRSWKPIALGVTLALSSQFSWAAVIETTRLVGFGEAKYPENFTHFDYVNPQAPKYGKVTFGELGTYDNFNRFASRGVAAANTAELYDPLMFSPADEIDSYYPLIASKIRYSNDFTGWKLISIRMRVSMMANRSPRRMWSSLLRSLWPKVSRNIECIIRM